MKILNGTEATIRESTEIIAESEKAAKKLVFTELELGQEFLKLSAQYVRQFVRRFKRVHSTGTAAELTQHFDVWRIQINLREPNRNPMTITGYVERSLASAKEWADKEIAAYGHVCTSACCKDWLEVR